MLATRPTGACKVARIQADNPEDFDCFGVSKPISRFEAIPDTPVNDGTEKIGEEKLRRDGQRSLREEEQKRLCSQTKSSSAHSSDKAPARKQKSSTHCPPPPSH